MRLPNGDKIDRVDVLGYPFDAVTLNQTVDCIREAVIKNYHIRISVGNVDMVMKAKKNSEFADVFSTADLVIADGVPILWASKLLGDNLPERVAGTELVWKCGEVSEQTGCNIGFIGGSFEIASRAARKINICYPSANLHVFSTPFPLDLKSNDILVNKIKTKKINILLVALGAPKQEFWIRDYILKTGANVGIGIGSAFDIISGDKPWAPLWMRDNGLEWLYRMKLEPRRLTKRYLIEDIPFFGYLIVDGVKRKLKGQNINKSSQLI